MPGKGSPSPLIPAVIVSLVIGGIGGYAVQHFRATAGAHPNAASTGSGTSGTTAPEVVLVRLVRNLSFIELVQKHGLSPQQAQAVLPILKAIQSADALPADASQAKIDAIEKALGEPQKQALDALQPKSGGAPPPDVEHLFASDRNKQALADLITTLGSSNKK